MNLHFIMNTGIVLVNLASMSIYMLKFQITILMVDVRMFEILNKQLKITCVANFSFENKVISFVFYFHEQILDQILCIQKRKYDNIHQLQSSVRDLHCIMIFQLWGKILKVNNLAGLFYKLLNCITFASLYLIMLSEPLVFATYPFFFSREVR